MTATWGGRSLRKLDQRGTAIKLEWVPQGQIRTPRTPLAELNKHFPVHPLSPGYPTEAYNDDDQHSPVGIKLHAPAY